MKIFVDENIPLMTVQALRDLGHDVRDIRRTADQGMTDDALWEMVQREGRLLITTDKGFAQHRDESHHFDRASSAANPAEDPSESDAGNCTVYNR
jgi:uncharacterized protein with PIN domain